MRRIGNSLNCLIIFGSILLLLAESTTSLAIEPRGQQGKAGGSNISKQSGRIGNQSTRNQPSRNQTKQHARADRMTKDRGGSSSRPHVRPAAPPTYWSSGRTTLTTMPRQGNVVINHQHNTYNYYGGHYYRHSGGVYVMVSPSFGVVVPSLPVGFVAVTIGGIVYYQSYGIYYRPAPTGYVVVEVPVSAEKPKTEVASTVVVKHELVNVRVGPSKKQDVVTTVKGGDMLNVLGQSPDWYFVELQDGTQGWVMEKFVAPVKEPKAPEPKG